ncbi:RNase H domain-containing protein [Trichonephila clavipes]|nr:RNase H domain-containing protein [Trichonephila clavipes]
MSNHHLVSCETRLTDFLSATKTLQILTEPYGDKTLSREWHKRFSGGKNGVEDDERAERPSELIATDIGLVKILSESIYGDLWILSDSLNLKQRLKNWAHIGDKISLSTLRKVKLNSHHHKVRFQWIPSHVNIYGDEVADTLAKEDLLSLPPHI